MTDRRDFLKKTLAGGAGALLLNELTGVEAFARAAARTGGTDAPASDPWARVPEILKRIKPPVFPKRDFAVTKYGAVADGKTDCTEAFRKAIAACNKAGGGRVVVPAGTFLTGPIHLLSNVNLHVSEGATVKFSQDPKAYLPPVFTRWEGMELMNYSPFVYAFEQKNIAITGEGTLDGNSDDEHWWPWKGQAQHGWKKGDPNQAKARKTLEEMTERGAPVAERVFGEGHYLRPQFVQPYRCENVLIEGVRVVNSPMWELNPVLCTNVTVRKVRIQSHGPNNDGCDPESCRDVLIEDCTFDTGDDCIAVKSGRNADGRRLNVPSENIVIRGCQMKDGHGGVTIGSEISGGVRYLFAENCVMDSPNLDHALRFKNNAVRGGLLENIFFRNITVGQVAHAVLTVDFNYEEGAKGKFKPVVRNLVVDGLKSGKSRHALDVQGFADAPVYDLRLKDCTFENVERPSVVKNVTGMTLENVRVNGKLVDRETLAGAGKVKIVLVGDSTVGESDGWGPGFKRFVSSEAEVVNLAKNGRSSKSYAAEGWWKKALEEQGDYIIIQFGHNDMPGKGPERETDPETTYAANVARYVDEARAAGAKPILVTSLTRRRFGKDDRIDSDLHPYANVVKRVATEKRVPLIDLHALSIALIDKMGRAKSDELGKMKPDGKGGQEMDYTHLGERGSLVFGRVVADELRRVEPALAAYVK
ncbi:MAG TPA: glycosyl hydrolase family 28 protein [Pyrinomonadaceae bacterium]|jgi:polygalacturonase/lysophospholipase L1-like esterase